MSKVRKTVMASVLAIGIAVAPAAGAQAAAATGPAVGARAAGTPGPAVGAHAAAPPTDALPAASDVVPHELIVRYDAGTDAAARTDARGDAGADFERRTRLANTEVVSVDGSLASAAARLERQPGVAFAVPNYVVHATAAAPNDPLFPQQWGLRNDAVESADVGALAAWDVTRGAGQTIAVLDTGVDRSHPDLSPNLWTNPGEIPDNGIDDDGDGHVDDIRGWDFIAGDDDPDDYHGHGTHVAGIAAAAADNGVGGAGVAPAAKILPVRVLDGNGEGDLATIVDGIDYAADHGATVINMSLGGQPEPEDVTAVRQVWTAAIGEAGTHGAVVVVAAGNDHSDNDAHPDFPCSATNANLICVAALNHAGRFDSSYSNYGASSVDVGAPGTSILSTVPAYEETFSDSFASTSNWTLGGSWGLVGGADGYLADSPTGGYSDGSVTEAVTTATVTSAEDRGCHLSFLASENLATGDRAVIGARPDGSSAIGVGTELTGTTDPEFFYRYDDSLEALQGRPARVVARLETNLSGTADGVFLDDVAVRCRVPSDTDGDYALMTGTSMASPYVAGVAALAGAAAPSASPEQVVAAVEAGAVPASTLAGRTVTGGRVDALRAIEALTGTTFPSQRSTDPPPGGPEPTDPAPAQPVVVPQPQPLPLPSGKPTSPARVAGRRSPCAGRHGAALRRCQVDIVVRKKCGRLKGAKKAVCGKRVRAQEACRALPTRTKAQRTKRTRCFAKAAAIGRPKPRVRPRSTD